MQNEQLSCLLWHERHGVTELFEAVNMVTFDPSPIALVKIVSAQIGISYNSF